MFVPDGAMYICETLRDAGHEAWLVGGAVRDSIMGRDAHDFDITTDAHPKTVKSLFKRVVPTGEAHGTVTVMTEGDGFEVTTYRGEGAYTDGRRPDEVRFLNTVEEDLARRDFTVNAIAYDPVKDLFCDPYGGQQDLRDRVLRAVGNPVQRFSEDGLRVLRAARFAATLGFEIEPQTLSAIPQCLGTFAKVSVERVHDELIKMMLAPRPSVGLEVMQKTGMIDVFIPEFRPLVGCAQNKYHTFDVWKHTLETVDHCPASDPMLRLAALFHDIGKPVVKAANPKDGDATFYDHEYVGADMTDAVLQRLKFSTEHRERIVHLVRNHYVRYNTSWAKSAIRRWVRRVGLEHVEPILVHARADVIAKGLEEKYEWIDELRGRLSTLQHTETLPTSTKVLAINGKDVMDCLGLKPGPAVGKVLNDLLEAVTDDPDLNTREALLDLVKTMGTVA